MKNSQALAGAGAPLNHVAGKGGNVERVRKVMRMKQLATYLDMSKSTLYDLQNPQSSRFDATFPSGVRLMNSTVVYIVAEVDAWFDAKVAAFRAADGNA